MKASLAVAALAWSALAAAAPAAEPAPPHGLGLLTGRVSEAGIERLRAALRDPQPETRAAAVRVINASGTGSLVPAVQEALATETDPLPGGEMVRLLAVLARPELDAAVLEAAKRLGRDVHLPLADGLGRRGVAGLTHLPALGALGPEESVVRSLVRLATHGGAIGPAAAPILRDGRAGAWRLLLENARETGTPVDPAPLPRASDQPAMRTVSEFPRGFVEDTLAATGCVLEENDVIRGGEVTYGADGRPRTVPAFAGAKGCDEAARVLVTSALAPLGVPYEAQERILLMVPARKAFLTSTGRGIPDVAARDSVGGSLAVETIREPKKIVNVNPVYPRASIDAKRQGTVVLEAWIGPTGDIYNLRLVQGVDRRLDLAAVGAVTGWKYTPTLLNGVPVPVLMTVTVNFKLS
jgi:TonB family protein